MRTEFYHLLEEAIGTPILIHEVQMAIKQIKTGKEVGPDNVVAE